MGRCVKIRLVLGVAMMMALIGCTQPYIVNTAIEYNKSLAQYVSEEILLNAVRASKRAPMSFSAIGGYTGLARKTGSISAFLPFSGLIGGSASPSIEGYIQDGTSFQNLNADQFTKEMKESISPDLMLSYLAQNWPPQLIFSIFVRKVTLKSKVFGKWLVAARMVCNNAGSAALGSPLHAKGPVCKALTDDLQRLQGNAACKSEYDEVTLGKTLNVGAVTSAPAAYLRAINRRASRGSDIVFSSNGRLECKFVKFKVLLHVLTALGYQHKDIKPAREYEYEQESQTIVSQRGPTKSRTVTKQLKVEKKRQEIAFVPILAVRGGRLMRIEPNRIRYRDPGVFELRSPQEMIGYLGQLIAAQNYDPLGQGFEPTIHVQKEYYPVEMFNVKRGLVAGAPVSITDDQGDIFSVHKPNYGGTDEDRSLRVISLIAQIIALKTVGGELPRPAQTFITTD